LAMSPDTDTERQFLIRLQGALGIDPALAAHLEDAVKAELQG
jgi:uncharacterized membrane protein YebE (DUF533 family)